MKKIVLLLMITLFLSVLHGNETLKKHHFNIFGGWTISELCTHSLKSSFTFKDDRSNRLNGFNAGFSLISKGKNIEGDFDPEAYLFLGREIGIRYVERGFKVNKTYLNETDTWKVKELVRSNYIDIFYKAKFIVGGEPQSFLKFSGFQPYIGLGVSFLADTNMDKYAYPSRTDIPLIFGFDIIFADKILIGYEVNYGILNVFNEKVYDKYPGHIETQHVNIGYLFGFNIE